MGMNKRAAVGLLFGVMIFIFTFIVAVVLIKPINDNIEIARGTGYLNCDFTNLTTGQNATCVVVDLVLPYFIAAVIAGGTTFLFMR